MNLEKVKDISVTAAKEAGKIICEVRSRGFGTRDKSDGTPVTEADIAADRVIKETLSAAFPDLPILSEETADDGRRLSSRFCFIVDPLDGTRYFIEGSGEFTVNIALADNGVPVFGLVYSPVKDLLYYAIKGVGAFRVTEQGETAIFTKKRENSLCAVRGKSRPDPRADAIYAANSGVISNFAFVGGALKGCLIAEGSADIYIQTGMTYEWDIAAAQCICETAGGYVGDLSGNPLTCNRKDPANRNGVVMMGAEGIIKL